MEWPQITWLILVGIALGIELAMHGKPQTAKHSFPSRLLATCLVFWLLWSGGFFSGGAC